MPVIEEQPESGAKTVGKRWATTRELSAQISFNRSSIGVDISRLTPNTAVDPDPTIRPKQVGCHSENTEIDGRTVTWMAVRQ